VEDTTVGTSSSKGNTSVEQDSPRALESAEQPGNSDFLDSWKEISRFLKRGIRTVQRWEATEGLPVHRHHHLKRGTVFAFASEIRPWLDKREGRLPDGDAAVTENPGLTAPTGQA
jgi:hypothetical protein